MNTYHKINTIYKRNPDNLKELLEGEFSLPEFEYLKSLEWEATEKIDGTNIRIMWDGDNLKFGGKTDNAQIPVQLLYSLETIFNKDKMGEEFGSTPVCLYGEGFGKGIQKGGNYIKDDTSFILFDIKIGQWWLKRNDIEDISSRLNLMIVPIIGYMNLLEAVDFVKVGFKSTISENKDYIAEGLILKPKFELSSRDGRRIITKIKHRDFI